MREMKVRTATTAPTQGEHAVRIWGREPAPGPGTRRIEVSSGYHQAQRDHRLARFAGQCARGRRNPKAEDIGAQALRPRGDHFPFTVGTAANIDKGPPWDDHCARRDRHGKRERELWPDGVPRHRGNGAVRTAHHGAEAKRSPWVTDARSHHGKSTKAIASHRGKRNPDKSPRVKEHIDEPLCRVRARA